MRALVLVLLLASCAAQRPHLFDDLHGKASAPVAPFRIVGDLYYVGAADIASYLIATPDGLILLDTGTREMVPVVTANIAKLGFRVEDIKILLSGHAHFDHVQGHAAIQRASGAQVMAMAGDAAALEAGVDQSPLHGEGWDPVHVDRVLHDGDRVELGGAVMTAHWIPGHTPGCTVWTTRTGGHEVAFYACAGPNTSVALIGNREFPNLVGQALAGFAKLRQLHPDIWLEMHPAGRLPPSPLVDPGSWQRMLDDDEAEFRARVHDEQLKVRAAAARSRAG